MDRHSINGSCCHVNVLKKTVAGSRLCVGDKPSRVAIGWERREDARCEMTQLTLRVCEELKALMK